MTFDKHFWMRALEDIFMSGGPNAANIRRVSVRLGVCIATIKRWILAYSLHGLEGPQRVRQRTTYENRLQALHLDFAIARYEENPTYYYKEVCILILAHFGVHYNKQQLCDALHGRGITRKVYYYNIIKCYSRFR
jgi:transposase